MKKIHGEKCRTPECKRPAIVCWKFKDGAFGYFCGGHSNALSEEIWRHAEQMSKLTGRIKMINEP